MKIFGVIIVVMALVYSVASYSIIEGKTISTIIAETTWFPPKIEKLSSVEKLIEYWAKESKANAQQMLKIAQCESDLDPKAKNPKSTASGVFQFVEGTWREKCRGNVFDASDNVRCAAQLIASGELSHWEESKKCWSQ